MPRFPHRAPVAAAVALNAAIDAARTLPHPPLPDPYTGEAAAARERTAMHRARAGAAKKSGATFEHYLQNAHAYYRREQLGVFSKLYPETGGAPRGRDGRPALFYKGKGDCDFLGWVRSTDGRCVPCAYDAKHTHRASFAMPTDPKNARTLLNQIDYLLDFSQPDTLAFLLVVDTELSYGWFLFADALEEVRSTGSVPLRTKLRGHQLTHHQPGFPLSTTEAIARGKPFVDWRDGLVVMGML